MRPVPRAPCSRVPLFLRHSILGVLKRATFDAAATGSDRVSLPVGAVEKIQLQVKTLGLLVADATPVTPSRPYSPATRLTVPTPTSTEVCM